MSFRPVSSKHLAEQTSEGAGVRLHRAFGFRNPEQFDPFLLFDDFRNENPADYQAGFPWHPHRGIETITYVLSGTVDHQDSLGNQGTLGSGDVQWMTSGSGILHQEMPAGNNNGQMHGFQLWANLPSELKMTTPRYQDIAGQELPVLAEDDGTRIKIIIGEYRGVRSPIDGIAADPRYLDITLPANTVKTLPVATRQHAFAYVFEGAAQFDNTAVPTGVLIEKEFSGQELNLRDLSGNRTLIEFGAGDEIRVATGPAGVRFLLVSGTPIQEPVAWHGPIVMNTEAELRQAMADLNNDSFIKQSI